MATAYVAKMLENPQHLMQLSPNSRNHRLSTNQRFSFPVVDLVSCICLTLFSFCQKDETVSSLALNTLWESTKVAAN
jgi:hypothetical protein